MKQQSDHAAEQAALYLQQMGLRSSTKGYQYLNFALTQLLQGTPFQNTIWELTSIYFGQTRKNVMACVRREVLHAFQQTPFYFMGLNALADIESPPTNDELLKLAVAHIRGGDS